MKRTTLPTVSAPIVAAHMPTANATALPVLLPPGLTSGPNGDLTWPPRGDQPFGVPLLKKLLKIVKFALPRTAINWDSRAI